MLHIIESDNRNLLVVAWDLASDSVDRENGLAASEIPGLYQHFAYSR